MQKNNHRDNSSGLKLKINEIFYSLQGESSAMGIPCVFIRLTYCNLRCSYCDSQYAFFEGTDMTIKYILKKIESYHCNLIEITGGEPLLQQNIYPLMEILCDKGYEVMLETAGHIDISGVDARVKRIVDLKCPSSGESDKNFWPNINYLNKHDEVKFVIGDRQDFDWSKEILNRYLLAEKCQVLFSPVFGVIELAQLAGWILQENLPVRMQLQLHKYIWSPDKRGV
jgi:7-carboxy-7-deazaguanine synthase